MDSKFILRGVPHRLARDGWWLADEATSAAPPVGTDGTKLPEFGRARRRIGLVVLILLADLLFWGHALGLSVALFAAAIFAVGTSDIRPVRYLVRPAALLAFAALPVVDHVQALSLAFLAAGLIGALAWAHCPEAPAMQLLRLAARFLGTLPRHWTEPLDPRGLARGRPVPTDGRLGWVSPRALLQGWALPIGGALVLVSLLMEANPVLARILTIDLDLWQVLKRALFWIGIGVFVSPFLGPRTVFEAATAPAGTPQLRVQTSGINRRSVLRALMLFNLLIGAQSLTDLSILLGGSSLPSGMTLAEYAHRGAYPLLATAILAGLFALTARPFLGEHRLIRPLLLLWMVQNVVLCGAAALRLELYIGSFGLTYLRLYSLIWMGVVAAGLALMLWQVLRERSNGWLMVRWLGLGLAVLYLCCFVNFGRVVAAQNVMRPDPDRSYLCSLGPLASGPIVESGIGRLSGDGVLIDDCAIVVPEVESWQGWGFRSWAAHRYVAAAARAKGPR